MVDIDTLVDRIAGITTRSYEECVCVVLLCFIKPICSFFSSEDRSLPPFCEFGAWDV